MTGLTRFFSLFIKFSTVVQLSSSLASTKGGSLITIVRLVILFTNYSTILYAPWSYLCTMLPDNDLQQRWLQLVSALAERLGKKLTLEDILLFIGVRESGVPPKGFTEREKMELILVAISTILVPAKYYELLWVEDTGWPHFKQLQEIQKMDTSDKEILYKKYILLYAEKNKLI